MLLKLIIRWFKFQAKKSALKVLSDDFTTVEIREVLNGYWNRYKKLKMELKKQPTLGGRVMVHLAVMSTAFYQEITLRGKDHDETAELFYKIAWTVYQKMGKFSWWVAGWWGRKKYHRLKKATDLFRTFPFNDPSYNWQDSAESEGVVGFDCLKCPVADYFKSKELSEFCVQTWCALDFPLAELWDSKLVRTNSIAGGANKCDFRWTPNSINK